MEEKSASNKNVLKKSLKKIDKSTDSSVKIFVVTVEAKKMSKKKKKYLSKFEFFPLPSTKCMHKKTIFSCYLLSFSTVSLPSLQHQH